MQVNEALLFYIWKFQRYDFSSLFGQSNEALHILHPGYLNTNAGPDFTNSRIVIDGITWSGNIEIHVKASDWDRHHHSENKAYDNVILHVVWEADKAIRDQQGTIIPCLELKSLVSESLLNKYRHLQLQQKPFPCHQQIKQVLAFISSNWLEKVLIERLEAKTERADALLKLNNSDWATTFYQILSRSFGMRVNSDAFEQLARSLPITVIAKHKNSRRQVEALIFGQANLLSAETEDAYVMELQKEYAFLSHKYALIPLREQQWKFLRLRPSNFPTVRLAQWAALIHQSSHLFSKILSASSLKELRKMFEAEASEYWNNHYTFGKESRTAIKKIGANLRDNIIINTVVPMVFYYGQQRGDESLMNKALEWIGEVPFEYNSITNAWAESGLPRQSAFHSQALLQLQTQYCDRKKCLNCGVGNYLLKSNP